MEITTNLIKHLANLSRLNFTENEIENFKGEFERTLKQIDELQSVDTENIETFNKTIKAQELREDIVKESLPNEKVILNAPKKSRGAIVVPKVVE